ncbi:hypothetical protein [Pontibacter ruber]|uniref:Uncharacterized protein n=1 Tax=Pontibacter ruber TaxID=1343895 RepID=A0ABW5CSJ7_9BACT|nr:hypothetical protein [Pontibacter ruber]
MIELTEFLTKLNSCDRIVLTDSEERTYCRFFRDGLYLDRMYVTDAIILAELDPLKKTSEEGEEVDAAGIAKLKQLFLAVNNGIVQEDTSLTE